MKALALEWWLREQNKFNGAVVCTRQKKDGTFIITRWEVSGIDKPTDAQIDVIFSDYEKAGKPLEQQFDVVAEINSIKKSIEKIKEKL